MCKSQSVLGYQVPLSGGSHGLVHFPAILGKDEWMHIKGKLTTSENQEVPEMCYASVDVAFPLLDLLSFVKSLIKQ